MNPSLGARWRHPCRQRSCKRQGHRTGQFAGPVEKRGTPRRWLLAALKTLHTDQLYWSLPAHRRGALGGMDAPRSLQGRTCSVSCDGGRARALQPSRRSPQGPWAAYPLPKKPTRGARHLSHHDLRLRHLSQTADQPITTLDPCHATEPRRSTKPSKARLSYVWHARMPLPAHCLPAVR